MSDILIEAAHLTRELRGEVRTILVQDASLAIASGEFVAITGASGSGKSSLLYLLGLLDWPTSGTIFLRGQDTTELDDDALAALRLGELGFVFQFHFPAAGVLGGGKCNAADAAARKAIAARDQAAYQGVARPPRAR